MLPTTRIWLAGERVFGGTRHVSGPPDLDALRKRPTRLLSRLRGHAKSLVVLGVNAPEEVYRQSLGWFAERRGRLVVQDRHPLLDYHASDVLGLRGWRRIGDRIHGYLIQHVYRGPGRVLLLDASADVLHARKPEGTLRSLEARRDEYLALQGVIADLHVVSVDRPLEEVLAEVEGLAGLSVEKGRVIDGREREYVLPAPESSRAVERAAQLATTGRFGVHDVLHVLAQLEVTGEPVWLDRGWGVDAIVGFVTREHRDIDLVTVPGALGALGATLESVGFIATPGEAGSRSAGRLEFVSPSGRSVEIREAADALEPGFGAVGQLGGVSVPCVDAGRQLDWRVGRKLSSNDVQAIHLLHETTGTPIPHPLRPLGKARMGYRARRLARSIVTLGEPDAATPPWFNRLRHR